MKLNKTLFVGGAFSLLPTFALAQEAAAPSFDEIGPYILTTLLFLVAGFLVFFMAAGFAMLEAGLVRSKNVAMQLTKNIALFGIASIMYWAIGFNLMYPGDAWSIAGWLGPFFAVTSLEPVGLAAADASLDYASVASDFFFQLMFVAATASIVSGALAERVKLWPFLAFCAILTGVMYPISGSWQWGGGWLSERGFSDFAGSTIVHSVGGWAALAGVIVLGPRIGKYKDGRTVPMPGSNLALATLGTFSANRVRKTTNATGASPTFTIMSSFPSTGEGELAGGIPCYSVIIDRDDENIIVVGTEFGLFASENGGTTWENVSGALGPVPDHDLEQNWRQWDEGCFRPGEIYAGTHARGIWSSDALLNIPSSDNLDKDKFVPNINLYPNPVQDGGTVEFDLASNGDVKIQIFNLSGQVVNQINANNLAAGKNQIAFDANDLPRGTYILRLTSGTMSETTKFIKH